MTKHLSVAIAAGFALALGIANVAKADGYEYYVPPPKPEKKVYEHHGYEHKSVRREYVYVHVQQSQELNGHLDFTGWSGGVGNTAGASGGGGGGFAVLGGNNGFAFGGAGAGAFAGAAAFAQASASASVSIGGGFGGGGHGGGHGGGGGH